MTQLRLLIPFAVVLLLGLSSCGETNETESGGEVENKDIQIGIQTEDGKTIVLDPEILKSLAAKKEVVELSTPPEIPAHTFAHDYSNNLQTPYGELKDPCYLHPDLKELVEATDFASKSVRNQAVRLASNNPGVYNLGQACDIFDYLMASWKYVNDPINNEYVAKASESIENEYAGDCDDFAVLLGSMLMSIGGDTRINYAFNPDAGHAFVEANMGSVNLESIESYLRVRYNIPATEEVAMRTDPVTNNVWLNMDWFAKNPGGPYFPYAKGVRYYVVDQHCETYTIISDLRKYKPEGNEIYEMLKLQE